MDFTNLILFERSFFLPRLLSLFHHLLPRSPHPFYFHPLLLFMPAFLSSTSLTTFPVLPVPFSITLLFLSPSISLYYPFSA